ncbi:kinase-like domain-containing protein [Phascolomyces articulosus]|uniref:Kinase-like domain-containing protein n=1 Tax=Phascolomyces articulosus TaxID=60185 RepID=A0AAD5KJ27_9FUNG|nr:kinase-like domain-containing protein [Phascolomyces articulosus]
MPDLMKRLTSLFKKKQDLPAKLPSGLTRLYKVSNRTLGVGSFAVVKLCTHKKTGRTYALKIVMKKAIAGKEQMLDNELDVLKQVRHPHIISMHGLFEDDQAVYIVTDHAKGGELFQQLLRKGSYTERDASNLVRQILEGLAYLHEHDIVHRDIKPENLLFQTTESEDKLMITDFGLSRIIKDHDGILMTACGTPGYVAPEILLRSGHGTPVDIWSVGVIMYTLLSGYTPFWGADEATLFDNIIRGQYDYDEEYWSDISSSGTIYNNNILSMKTCKLIIINI